MVSDQTTPHLDVLPSLVFWLFLKNWLENHQDAMRLGPITKSE